MTDFAIPTQFVPQAALVIVRPTGQTLALHGTTDASRGAALASALNLTSAGDVIRLGGGVFDLGTTENFLADGVAIEGAGRGQTVIQSATAGCVLTLAAQSRLRDLSVHNLSTGTTGIAVQGGTNYTLHDCELIGIGPGLASPAGGLMR